MLVEIFLKLKNHFPLSKLNWKKITTPSPCVLYMNANNRVQVCD